MRYNEDYYFKGLDLLELEDKVQRVFNKKKVLEVYLNKSYMK